MLIRCGQCGGKLRRVHRTLFERFQYLAVYECRDCDTEAPVPRPSTYHLGPHCRCPRCGTLQLVRLKKRDRIDGMHHGFLNLVERLAGGRLIHCRLCRLQFYDRRVLASEAAAAEKQEAGSAKN